MALLSSLYDHVYGLVTDHPWALLVGLLVIARYAYKGPDLSHIPTAGSNGILSYWEGLRSTTHAERMLKDGYMKFRGTAFKIALPSQWQVVIASLDMVDELRLADEADLSLSHATVEALQSAYTFGLDTTHDAYHVDVIRTPLTRSLGIKFAEVYDEVIQSFEDLVPANEKDWLAVPIASTILQLVCRTTNRLFVGLPLCRNTEWIDLNINFPIDVFVRASIINLFPDFLKPIAGPLLSPLQHTTRIGRKYLQNEVKQRIEMDSQYGKHYDGRPNDAISWLLEYAKGEERTVDRIIQRLLAVNMAAIHTSSNSLAIALINLAAYPEHILPMRQEIAEVISEYGWTKAALYKMRKVDSFLKESARFEGIGAIMNRKVMNPAGFTFKNGLYLPYGAIVGIPTTAIHQDKEYYENPLIFNGFRYSRMRDDDGEGYKHQMVATKLDYLNFGYGKHACPGRFFAANELKTILAHLILTYDIALEGSDKPKPTMFGFNAVLSPKAKLLFKRLPV